jgi:hypothetical protein
MFDIHTISTLDKRLFQKIANEKPSILRGGFFLKIDNGE